MTFFVFTAALTGNNCKILLTAAGDFAVSFCASRSLSAGFVTVTSGADVDIDDFLDDCCAPKAFQ
jgi:hypothetical protein